jgi:hypothetical protein
MECRVSDGEVECTSGLTELEVTEWNGVGGVELGDP